jgi:PAS domain-containing protein
MAANEQPSAGRVNDIVELVKRFCLAMVNVEMFTANHPVAKGNINDAYQWLRGILDRDREPVVISVSGATVVLDGLPLEERNPMVSKFAARLNDLHALHLAFEPAITEEEFHEFYRVMGLGPRTINERGGLAAQLEERKISNIRLRDVSYVMVTENEKVVRRDAKVVDGAAAGKMDGELAKYMVGEVLKRTEEQKWLLNEIKNSPARVAELITEGIKLAISRAGIEQQKEGESVSDLIENIRLVCAQLADESATEAGETPADLERAIITLERELCNRTSRMTASKEASGLVNEILTVVSSYTDQVRAKKIASEFVKGEKSLDRMERLLRKIAPNVESPDAYLLKVSELVRQRGIKPEEIESVVKSIRENRARPASPRKVRRKADAPLVESVARRLKNLNLDTSQAATVSESLGELVEERARERVAEAREEVRSLRGGVARRNKALDQLPVGVVLWGQDGAVDFVNRHAGSMLGDSGAPVLSDALRAALAGLSSEPSGGLPQAAGLSESEAGFLAMVHEPLRDESGVLLGAIMRVTI